MAASTGGARYDVVVCGGGLAGLTLARQLKREVDGVSVAVIEPHAGPLPRGTWKVGESITEMGTHYLEKVVGLGEHLTGRHLVKCGLRFFYNTGADAFADRPEVGLSRLPVFTTYQLDRGLLETDLRELAAASGVDLLPGWRASRVDLGRGESGDADRAHAVTVAGNGGAERVLTARWVVDATGRRRLLQKQLGLAKSAEPHCSSAWFRVPGIVNVAELVPADAKSWHERVPGDIRWRSTNHLMGDGYWVWVIPLPCDMTSIGVVVSERHHDFRTIHTFAAASRWLEHHEPELARRLEGIEPLDFLVMRKYSYASTRVVSAERWACVGESGQFPDPFYAPGTDIIGFGNMAVVDLVTRDRKGELDAKRVDRHDQFLRSINYFLMRNTQRGYPFHGHAVVAAAKFLWDVAVTWGYFAPQMFNRTFLDDARRGAVRRRVSGFIFLQSRMQKLFEDWHALGAGALRFTFLDYLRPTLLRELRDRNLVAGKTTAEIGQIGRAHV